ncbi:hypothetical protein OHB41_49750 [Streptomyces sp. NBC_01571]|uniref:hypothetical protein n=1 Tax=Streptomyces sp. NBC_01571 TaxID=2975883 RepID=UPI00225285A2|nr:hypothetical protein [Streptomyces sp. NBC_01571]MCX4581048.1 hypothetical protein [Streptomyces sp. NBC_01571]
MNAPHLVGDWIRGITIRQPWATCILAGKTVENRTVHWPWRGWVLIHVGKAKPEPAVLRDPLVATAIRGRELHLGAVIGVARLVDCHLDQGPERCTNSWAQRAAHHLVLADVHELALPVPARGALSAWKPTRDLVGQVLQQLPGLKP